MSDLFESGRPTDDADGTSAARPLAVRMRPKTLDDILGQDHILGRGRLLRRAIEADRLSSVLLFGPPGCGKTTLAEVIALATRRSFERASGVLSNVAQLRDLLEAARRRLGAGRRTILFVDEIHRFNKAQQDVLLPYVEDGIVTLVGATTHNPCFFVNSPLVSRSQVFELTPLDPAALATILRRALRHPDGLANTPADVDEEAIAHLARMAEGDARRALNALEIAVLSTPPGPNGRVHITREIAEDSIQKKAVVYDADEDGHYDTISAFIKSVRGSDPHAAIYWLAKMLRAGEDPRFIARRLVILASEDIGNADPRGLTVAVAAAQAAELVGMPEARILLAQATAYLATAPKSNAAIVAIDEAMEDVERQPLLPVPMHLRDAHYAGAERLGHTGYQYAHDGPGHFVDQDYAPTSKAYYRPSDQGYEDTIRRRMELWDSRRTRPRTPLPPS